jgi:hypothetical protein
MFILRSIKQFTDTNNFCARMEVKKRDAMLVFSFYRNITSAALEFERGLAARGESTIGRVLGDAGTSSRSANAADAPATPEPFGRIGIAGNLCVARRQ